jgi:SAM-dependent methyltransferase
MIFSDKKSAISVQRGNLHLSCCRSCGFIFNSAFQENLVMYGNTYDNRQHFSEYFHQYMKKISEFLIQKKGVTNSRIIEVGCGDGTFLRLLLDDERNRNTGIGFDPSYRGPETDCNGRVRFIIDYYDQKYADLCADVVVSRHVIEHIADPVKFLIRIRDSLGKQEDSTIFLETPDVKWILKNNTFWDFCYEHCSYFSPESLSSALKFAGFRSVELIKTFNGQYMLSVAKPSEKKSDNESRDQSKNKISDFAEKYAQHEQDFVEKDRSVLKNLSRTGNIFLWGAGAKGVMYANMIDPNSKFISGIVDVNPDKQGGFIPGSGHKVISPNDLPQSGSVIIMNENYTEEIKKQISSHRKEIRLYSVHRIAEQIT